MTEFCRAVWWLTPFVFLFGRLLNWWDTTYDKTIMVLLMGIAILLSPPTTKEKAE